ncbi:MAG: anhydro-N-acetylmuramic acid kinase [Bacteroidales bacterium]|jgi:anhydro-N-acetylmuramic acid kinase|nr:anhydro-N-acetylmuramic acid kinase [Bacteroidales bacterium]
MYKVLGLMSGTSLDGLDLAYCEFELSEGKWQWSIQVAETIEYEYETQQRILSCETCNAETLARNHVWLGHFFGSLARDFISRHRISPMFISSHGQTIFHQPSVGMTCQIGDLNAISAETQCDVIGNFRALDVALGGQGAPLVPIGDRLLFSQYPYCLNLGGFANVSFESNGKRLAYDVVAVNTVLNMLAQRLGLQYDNEGLLARNGVCRSPLLNSLNALPYYSETTAKSLGREWVTDNVLPLLNQFNISIEDTLSTYTEHIAHIIAGSLRDDTLVTGGGAYNSFLLSRIMAKTQHRIILPDPVIINYKEALVFAFLGVLRERGEVNVLSSVTGSCRDSSSGEKVIFR